MAYQSEAELELQFIEQLNSQKYATVEIPDYDALVENFKVQFEKFNAAKLDHPLTDKEWERVFNLMLGKSVFQSAKILRDKFVLEREDGTKVYLAFFDNDHTKNIFQVTHQTTVVGKYVNRYDVTLLVNGLPLIQVELKRRGIDIREAVNQVMRYKKHSYNGLYHFIQLFIVSNGVDTKYFANSDRDLLYSLAFFWTDFNNVRITNLKDFSISFLARDHVIKMLTRYTIINDTDKILMVMRPYQVYAVEALVRQATLTNRNAYIWHTTGAGKTLTSFKTAQILAANPNIKKVIFLVDRKDLDSQTTEEFNKFEAGSVDATDRTDLLVKQIQDKNRQLIITTIQKMANAVKNPRYAKIMSAYADEKVVFIIDECHRSQFGDMHKDIVRHFKNAQFFGFTGTPRFEVNGKVEGKITQTTEKLFGECLHNYLIKDAIFDNNVLGFHVEYIKTMEGDFDLNDPTMTNAIDVGELYMSTERMALIANHIVQNHKSKTRNGQYTAIFAVSSIPQLVKYYDIFKAINHDLNISGIFSYGANEDAEGKDEHSRDALERIIGDYNEMYSTNFSTDTFSAYHKDISDRVKGKRTKSLDILIVVNMFLTGFDSKALSVLYVDKDLRYHDLLQAYSRTNRVEKETKPFGIIICYRNLKKYKRGVVKTLLDPKQNKRNGVVWETDTIGNLGTFIKGAALSKADISDTGTPFILYGELYTTYKEVVRAVVRTTQASVDDVYLSRVGDVVVPTSGETPEEISTASCIMVPDVILAGDLNIYRSTIIDGRIMSYLLNHIVNDQIARVAQGKSVVHVQASEIGKISITYPDHKEQERIAQILELLDNRIAISEMSLNSMQEMKKALLQQLFI